MALSVKVFIFSWVANEKGKFFSLIASRFIFHCCFPESQIRWGLTVGPAHTRRQWLGSQLVCSPRLAFGPDPSDSVEEQQGQWIPKERIPECFGSARSVYFKKAMILLTAHIQYFSNIPFLFLSFVLTFIKLFQGSCCQWRNKSVRKLEISKSKECFVSILNALTPLVRAKLHCLFCIGTWTFVYYRVRQPVFHETDSVIRPQRISALLGICFAWGVIKETGSLFLATI